MEEENKNNVGAKATTETTGADNATETKKSFDELLKDKEYQSAFDKKIAQSLQTAKVNWEKENQAKQAEAERLAKMDEDQKKAYELQQITDRATKAELALNAYKLKDETIRQASEKGIPIDLIQTLDFDKETAESITSKLDIFEKTYKSEREKAIDEYSREPAPQTGDRTTTIDINNMTYSQMEEYLKKHPEAKI